jgi:small-conductance mechanosensitive channel
MMSPDKQTDVLLAEYAAMREEIRMMLNSMDNGLRTMLILIGALLTIAVSLRDERVLFLIPTAIFLTGIGQLVRATSTHIVGTYCQAIQQKLRCACGADNVVMNWEGSKLWKNIAHPRGIVHIGFFFVFIIGTIAFGLLAYRAYLYWKPSLAVHLLEAVFLVVYTIITERWNLVSRREAWVKEILNGSNQASDATSEPAPGAGSSAQQG